MALKKYFFIFAIHIFMVPCIVSAVVLNRIVATIGVGDTPSGIAITPDGKTAYVANNNNDGLVNGNTVSVINLATNTVTKTISDASFDQPYTVTINKAGTKVYITNTYGTTISIIDTATNTVTGVITGLDGPSGMVITPSGTTAYVNNYGAGGTSGSGNTVNIINLTTNTVTGSITVDQAPASLAITPDGAFVYVINYVDGNIGTGTINVIDTTSNTIVARIPGFSGPYAIQITADGLYAYVTNFGSNNFSPYGTTVSVVNIKTNTVIKTITVGIQPSGLAFSPNQRFAYVSNYNTLYLGAGFTDLTPGQGTINIIDLCNNTVLPQALLTGASPDSIAVSLDGRYLYVTNYSSNNVSVIDIYDKMWLNIC